MCHPLLMFIRSGSSLVNDEILITLALLSPENKSRYKFYTTSTFILMHLAQ